MKTIAQQLNVKEFPFIINDKNGNEIYWENLIGGWSKREFDSNGKEIYYENSDGFWCKKEFDCNGNRIYFENSNGVIKDKKPKSSCEGKIAEIDGKKYELKLIKK